MKRTATKAHPLQIPSQKEWEEMLHLSDLPIEIGRIADGYTLDAHLKKAIGSMTATEAREGAVRVREILTQVDQLAKELTSLKRVLRALVPRLQAHSRPSGTQRTSER